MTAHFVLLPLWAQDGVGLNPGVVKCQLAQWLNGKWLEDQLSKNTGFKRICTYFFYSIISGFVSGRNERPWTRLEPEESDGRLPRGRPFRGGTPDLDAGHGHRVQLGTPWWDLHFAAYTLSGWKILLKSN